MKIAYIANIRIPTEKAHGFQIMKVCEKMALHGVDVNLIIPDRKNSITKDAFEFYGIKKVFPITRVRVADTFYFEKIIGGNLAFIIQSLLFSISLFRVRVNRDAVIYTRNPEIVWLYTLRGYRVVYNAHFFPTRKFFISLCINKNVKIVCNSKGTREEFLKNGWKQAISISNGVDTEDFDSIVLDKASLRKECVLPIDKKIALYSGHLYTWKGIDVVISAAKITPEILFVIVGGTIKDVEKYQLLISQEHITNVLFLGHKEKSSIPRFIKSADVLLIPNIPNTKESESYTSPIKMFEYMASGVPIIASDLPSLREILNKENAYLVPANNVSALSEMVKKVCHDNGVIHIAQKAKKDVKMYSWDAHVLKLIEFVS